MPFYEYVCTSCGAATEILQKISDPPRTTCPECHAEALTKQISAAGFRLKGGGWYETDFKSGAQRNLAKGGGEGAPADGAKLEAAAQDKAGHSCGAGCGHQAGAGKGKGSEGKSGEGNSPESNSGDSKRGDSKAGEGKSGDAKPGAAGAGTTTAAAPTT